MHQTAMQNAQAFSDVYVKPLGDVAIAEIGSQDVNGSIRQCFGHPSAYYGVDFAAGNGVDVVLEDPYKLPFLNETLDVVVSTSCLEHSEFFWLTFTEMARVLKPGGLLFLSVPSNGPYHFYPKDCWRFYPDSGLALAKWASRQGYPMALLESFITGQSGGNFNDFVAVFVRDPAEAYRHPVRMMDKVGNFEQGQTLGKPQRVNAVTVPEDQRIQYRLMDILKDRLRQV